MEKEVDKILTDDNYELLIGENIRQMRRSQELSIEELAAKVNVSPTTLRNLEKGKGGTISLLINLLKILHHEELLEKLTTLQQQFSPFDILEKV
jgi:transcriptional regulator with XRE-family HTH domain